MKTRSRNDIIQKLAGASWVADATTLRKVALALVYSTAEYCCPVWLNSAHVHKMDALFEFFMRIVTGTIKSTPTSWLTILSNIYSQAGANFENLEFNSSTNSYQILSYIPDNEIPRLKSRKPFWFNYFLTPKEIAKAIWQCEWNTCYIQNKDLITDPSNKILDLTFRGKFELF